MGWRGMAVGAASRVAGLLYEPFRASKRESILGKLKSDARPFDAAEMAASAMVFAPHPDDETLGCGGVIALKRRKGADVTIAFVTDGAASDADADPASLAARRHEEALAASRVLGVDAAHVRWLGFPDGRLSLDAAKAVDAVVAVLDEAKPAQVFIPYGFGEHPDHAAAGQIVLDAIARRKARPAVFEYPIWFWRHWPWVAIEGREASGLLAASRRASFGEKLRSEFTRRVDVSETLAQKREALSAHRSQMGLADVSRGEFLKCFFTGDEWFRPA